MTITLDLARQLREAAARGYFYNHSSLVMEAAAEIVKQRLTIARLRLALQNVITSLKNDNDEIAAYAYAKTALDASEQKGNNT
jgi:hypothetical protein